MSYCVGPGMCVYILYIYIIPTASLDRCVQSVVHQPHLQIQNTRPKGTSKYEAWSKRDIYMYTYREKERHHLNSAQMCKIWLALGQDTVYIYIHTYMTVQDSGNSLEFRTSLTPLSKRKHQYGFDTRSRK